MAWFKVFHSKFPLHRMIFLGKLESQARFWTSSSPRYQNLFLNLIFKTQSFLAKRKFTLSKLDLLQGRQQWKISLNLHYRWDEVFSKYNENESSSPYKKNWRTNSLNTGALLGLISDIHRVYTNLEDLVDVRNEPKEGTSPQAICSLYFLMWIWGVILILFEKTWPVLNF